MAETEELPDEVKTFIVQALACYDTPSVVAAAVKDDYGITVSRQRVHAYDPTKVAGKDLSEQFRTIFEQTRKEFLEETAKIGIANRAVRLRKLDRVVAKAEAAGNSAMVMAGCEAAAKEAGGAFTNRHHHELTGANGKPLGAAVVFPADLSTLTTEQLAALYREAAASTGGIQQQPAAAEDRDGVVPPGSGAAVSTVGVDVQSQGSGEGTPGESSVRSVSAPGGDGPVS